MVPWKAIDTATVPGEEAALRLMRRGDEFSIMIGGNELMNSRMSGSEEALATLAAERLSGVVAPRILIGGYGMGFTLRAALAAFAPDATIEIAELVPSVVEWARGPMVALTAGSLDDVRVSVAIVDVGEAIAARPGAFDAILLDVDNGPDGLTRASNDRLYGPAGLGRARAALRAGGILAVWSAAPSPRFAARLRGAGFDVEEVGVKANRGRRGARHVVWLARRP